MSEERARKWMWGFLAALVALQIYFVRELLAALILFSLLFALVAVLAGISFLVRQTAQRQAWAEASVRARARVGRALTVLGELSRKPFRRPRSEPVQ